MAAKLPVNPLPSASLSLSRRDLLRSGLLLGAGLTFGGALLEACGSSTVSGIAGSGASSDTLAQMRATHYVRMSSYQQPPHGWFDINSGKWGGLDVDLVQYILPKLGVTHWDYVTADWSAMIPGLEAKRWDLMSIGMSFTKVRAAQVNFSAPAYQYGEAMMVRKGNPYHILGQAQWPHHRIGGILGSVDDQVIGGVAGATYVPYQKYSDMYQDLDNGRIDAGLVDELEVGYDFQLVPQPNIDVLHDWQGKTSYVTGLVMRKQDNDLKAAVDPIIATMKSDGTMTTLLAKYGLGPVNEVPCNNPTNFAASGALEC